ncbi:MAG: hypothetical protein FJ272_09775 [Planctomycetes bacterium]|nr:hypothetical protein [Planctomycetota bacterium]
MPATPLTYDEVKRAVERKGNIPRVPLFWHKFYNQGTIDKYGDALKRVSAGVVDDCVSLGYTAPGNYKAPEGCPTEYRWAIEPEPPDWAKQGVTSRLVVSSTEKADEFIAHMPDPSSDLYFAKARQAAANTPGRYRVGWDFFCFFEAMWFRFGMENILADMLANPARIERLCWAFTDYHKKVATKYAEVGAHAFFTSDDLGTQTTLMFSPTLFRSIFKPCYAELARHCHKLGLSFWLHCCGAVTALLDDFIAMGVDVIHPIQPYAMNPRAVAEKYAGRVTFLAGIDVQYLLPKGTVEDVARGTRELIDTFDRAPGGCLLAASNGIMPETPLENIRAWLTTAEAYGAEKRQRYSQPR